MKQSKRTTKRTQGDATGPHRRDVPGRRKRRIPNQDPNPEDFFDKIQLDHVAGLIGEGEAEVRSQFMRRFPGRVSSRAGRKRGRVSAGLAEVLSILRSFQRNEKARELAKILKNYWVLVRICDQFFNTRGLKNMNQVAKVLGTGRTRLFEFLRADRVFFLIQNSGESLPYQRYIEAGYFVVKERISDGRCQIFVTRMGEAWLAKRLREAASRKRPQVVTDQTSGNGARKRRAAPPKREHLTQTGGASSSLSQTQKPRRRG